MCESFLKLYHFTPQTFVFEDEILLDKYLSLIKTRLLSKSEIDHNTFAQYSQQGAFWIVEGDLETYFKAFNQVEDLPVVARDLLKLLLDKQRLVSSTDRNHFFGPDDEVPDADGVVACYIADEDNLRNAISGLSEIDGFICSDTYFTSLTSPEIQIKPKSIFFTSAENVGFWNVRSNIIEPNTINALVDALKTLLTFSANVSIYDTFMDPREAQYDNFIEVLKVCGNDLSPSEVKIITGPKRGSRGSEICGENELTHGECRLIAERLVSVLNENQRHLNIRKIDLQFWDYLHDRAITTFYGGYLLGQGLKSFGVRNSRDRDETRRTGPWNKDDAEKHDAIYDRENSPHNIRHEFELSKNNEGWHIF